MKLTEDTKKKLTEKLGLNNPAALAEIEQIVAADRNITDLEHFRAYTQGLYATEDDPRTLTKEELDAQTFRIFFNKDIEKQFTGDAGKS